MGLADNIQKTYAQAAKKVKKKLDEYTKHYQAQIAVMQKRLESGKISQEDYNDWLERQIFRGKRWQEKLDDITKTYVDADGTARELVGDRSKNVFARFANSTARDIQNRFNGGVSFDMYDRHAVERLLKENPQMLPEWKINEKKDYRWNAQRVQNAIAQGIIQGESIPQLTKRLTSELSAGSAKHMTLFARTAMTGAQNAGRIERLHEAQDMGIVVKKKWLAAHDDRVRDAHAELDGQEVGIDEPFHSSLGDIMYPGDPTADPANVYNCRCTLTYVYDVKASKKQMKRGEGQEEVQEPSTEQVEQVKQTQNPVDYFDMETTREISAALSETIGRPVDLQGMDKTLAARTARLYTDLANEYGMRASSIGMNNKRAAFGQVNHKYTGEKKLTFSKSMFDSPDKLREMLMGEQRKGQTIPIRGGVILDYVQTHEFAHLFGSSLEDIYYNVNQPFWREIGAVMREYINDRSRPLGKYAAQNIDEFMAEAFADGYLNPQPTEYGRKVKEIVDKYFGRRK